MPVPGELMKVIVSYLPQRSLKVKMDITQAYNSTWHTGLLYKLIQVCVPGELMKVIESYLPHRSLRVKMDMSQAYDSRWPTGLRYKLIQVCVPGELKKVNDSYLADRSLRVKVDGAVSEWKPMLAGVPQGSTLYLMLYNVYI